ncbi:MAG: hypothetical protein AAB386_05460 [Patescibacteria group bacterium]
MFLQIDGIDGSGKSTLLNAARAWAEERGLRVIDTVAWSKENGRHPTLEDVGDADVLLTAEPTHAGIGKEIREEIIRTNTPYNARFAAEAFSLDREVQYTRLILPFLQARDGRIVIQDRGLLSSLAYQPLQSETDGSESRVDIPWLLSLEGNRIALSFPPDAFIFLDIDPTIAKERLANRAEKIDNHVYDASAFQIALAERYRMPEVTEPLTSRGTRLIVMDGSETREEIAEKMRQTLTSFTGKI